MKKIFLLLLFAFGGAALAQNGNGNLEQQAKQAAIDAGCITNGAYDYSVNIIGGCACGPATTCAWTEVYILPKVNPQEAPLVRLAPLARVEFCGNEVISVTCY